MTAPLAGIRILDFTRFQAGPTGTVLLSDLGAEILKVEPPGRGDEGRYIMPVPGRDMTPYFIAHDRGKKSLALDYHKPEGREVLYRLAERCDAAVENFRPGVAEKMGLGWEDFRKVNPKLVYASVSAFGDRGPRGEEPGFDIHGQAVGGIMSVAGAEDGAYTAGAAIGDQLAGMTLATAVLGGLLAARLHGEGQKVHVSLYGCQVALQAWEIDQCSLSGDLPAKAGTTHPLLHGTGMVWGSYPTKEGHLALGGLGGERWKRFCQILGLAKGDADDGDSAFLKDRSGYDAQIRAKLQEKTAEEWMALFRGEDLMVSRVQNYRDILDDPQARANGYVVEMADGAGKPMTVVGSPFHFSATPVVPQGPPPELGQHTELLLNEFGYEWEEIDRLREAGVI